MENLDNIRQDSKSTHDNTTAGEQVQPEIYGMWLAVACS